MAPRATGPVSKRSGRSTSRTRRNDTDGPVAEWLAFLGAPPDRDFVPFWPPDAFAYAAALLRRTGAYVALVNGFRSETDARRSRGDDPVAVGQEWRAALEEVLGDSQQTLDEACPRAIQRWWTQLMSCGAMSLGECAASSTLVEAATSLCIASDEASVGIGIGTTDEEGIPLPTDPFLAVADSVLRRNGCRSFCLTVEPSKLAVLGKQHTPQRGCTIRSLTHHLALYTPTEIQAFWWGPFESADRDPDVFNLLLLPWPADVQTGDFSTAFRRSSNSRSGGLVPHHRYFEYRPTSGGTPAAMARRVEHALKRAAPYVDKVHGIVLPELALTSPEFEAVERVAVRHGTILIAGVRAAGSPETHGMPVNGCAFQPLGLTAAQKNAATPGPLWDAMRQFQLKHHRWCLDRNQVLQYGLGGRIPASRDSWERAFIGRRDVNFVTLGSWLTTCVLICEDLARQDPLAEVIRSVGPNLVFALLMDGPQLRGRWASRYASVLAEDPGCSVLTLTSLGMAKRSRPREATEVDRSQTIALWRDAIYGEQEISLSDGHDACILSLVCKTKQEFTIDGRGDDSQAHFPVFAGVASFASQA